MSDIDVRKLKAIRTKVGVFLEETQDLIGALSNSNEEVHDLALFFAYALGEGAGVVSSAIASHPERDDVSIDCKIEAAMAPCIAGATEAIQRILEVNIEVCTSHPVQTDLSDSGVTH